MKRSCPQLGKDRGPAQQQTVKMPVLQSGHHGQSATAGSKGVAFGGQGVTYRTRSKTKPPGGPVTSQKAVTSVEGADGEPGGHDGGERKLVYRCAAKQC